MPGQLENGKKLGARYEILGSLGRGGMASVYRACQLDLDRDVAIKVMAEQFASDPTFTKRFQREANAIARLKHPNILTIYEQGEDNGLLYIVMELIEGDTLKDQLNIKPITPERSAEILTQIANALDFANSKGIIHRDVKPSNVLMDQTGRAVLSDFGIAKMAEANTQLTSTGMGVGTPDYMSPEQAMGEPLDVRSDEYSLGVMVYEMLTGRVPFTGDTPIAIVMGHISKPLPSVRKDNTQIPLAVEQVLIKALAKKPEERYDSCSAFAKAFAEAVRSPDSQSLPTQILDTSNFSTNGVSNTEADKLYQQARMQEQQNNYYGAFDTFHQLNDRFPNHRDVPSVLANYHQMGYGRNQGPLPTMSNVPPPAATPPPYNNYYPAQAGNPGSYTPAPPSVVATVPRRSGKRNLGIILVVGVAFVLGMITLAIVTGDDPKRPGPGFNPGGSGPLPANVPTLVAPRDGQLYSTPYVKDGIAIPSVVYRPGPNGSLTLYGLITNTTPEPLSFSGKVTILDLADRELDKDLNIQTLHIINPNSSVPFIIQSNKAKDVKRLVWNTDAKSVRADNSNKYYGSNNFKIDGHDVNAAQSNLLLTGKVTNIGSEDANNLQALVALYDLNNSLVFVSGGPVADRSGLARNAAWNYQFIAPGPQGGQPPPPGQFRFEVWFEGSK